MEQMERIKKEVSEYARKNSYLIPYEIYSNKKDLEHVIDVGTSIMCTKWEVGYAGGGFVQAVVNNNLDEAVGRADMTCVECLKFFSTLKNSLGYVN
jgi:hypothetical protein